MVLLNSFGLSSPISYLWNYYVTFDPAASTTKSVVFSFGKDDVKCSFLNAINREYFFVLNSLYLFHRLVLISSFHFLPFL